MPSKKPAESKRAKLPRASDYTRDFLKHWQRLSHSSRYDMNRLKEAVTLLIANDRPSPPEWVNHPLTGDWTGHRECHSDGGFLLIYTLDDAGKSGLVVFVRSATHAELFLVSLRLTTPIPPPPMPACTVPQRFG
ncbi:type II toxin-antitoxin system YafQ family toxin [Pandoraea sputorum]|uniref:type II toxin-antitoxin system YafQ family toxin n=1 Tax=Pandoraea sputorum TaxID=93222 RepID=UPI001242C9F6|nr:type II toxin-antitoxin system YafQ family toxin [Pandoraea sputorum]VVE54495.1 addiction module toxin RelE [Pandoraea sputorum]